MDSDTTTLIIVLSASALLTSLAVALKSFGTRCFHCRSCCCESDCSKTSEQSEQNEQSILIPSNGDDFITLKIPSQKTSPISIRKSIN